MSQNAWNLQQQSPLRSNPILKNPPHALLYPHQLLTSQELHHFRRPVPLTFQVVQPRPSQNLPHLGHDLPDFTAHLLRQSTSQDGDEGGRLEGRLAEGEVLEFGLEATKVYALVSSSLWADKREILR